ncbi:LAETG motif-containing sortase-dependent surface protein [Streptomyces sp. NPDC079167]|uniref:LAETG motif-containing sortase-dependent surface protein n=1 Tax=Streptomyces sp. NPDC079167 TaxID=3154513 RepID=UPI0034311A94
MKIRQILATAVAAAVTTPALLLSVTPAFADDKPTAQTQKKQSVAELEKAAAAAQAAYDDALAAENAAKAFLESLDENSPLALAAKAAEEAAAEAAAAKTAADQAVVDAKVAVEALPDTATDEDKAAAAAAVTEAEAAAVAADEAKTAADAKAVEADTACDDERVAAARAIGEAQKVTKQALADKNAADAALAKAKEEEAEGGEGGGEDDTCVPEPKLTTVVTGLPSTVVAGTKVNFKLRVTNGTDKTLDEVFPFVYAHATDRSGRNDLDHLVHLQWSSASSSTWKNVDNENYIEKISPLKAGAHADIKLRLTVDAEAPAGNGVTFVAGDYWNGDGTCGGSPDLEGYEFMIAAAGSNPGKVPDAKPSSKPKPSGLKPQSGASASPVSGSLAATGSSSATSQLALASGAALAIGAGAVFVVRRRKAGSHS